MRRIALWLLSTVAVVTLLFGYRTSTSGPGTSETVAAAPAAPQTTTEPTSVASGATTVAGSVAQTRWGPVQVRITVAGGTLTAVDVLQYPNGNGKDRQINAYALPILTREALAAQSADIDMVSGATITSTGYVQSLQAALDRAGIA